MKRGILVTALTAAALVLFAACQSDDAVPAGPGASTETYDIQYGVWGYVVYDDESGPVVGDVVEVVCSCGATAAKWYSYPTDNNGYWDVEFTSTEASAHNGHGMTATDIDDPNEAYTDFTYYSSVTGPVTIYVEAEDGMDDDVLMIVGDVYDDGNPPGLLPDAYVWFECPGAPSLNIGDCTTGLSGRYNINGDPETWADYEGEDLYGYAYHNGYGTTGPVIIEDFDLDDIPYEGVDLYF